MDLLREQLTSPEPNKVFVGRLPTTATAETLRQYFSAFGVVENVSLVKEAVPGKSRGCAIVEFAALESVAAAFLAPEGHKLDGQFLRLGLKRRPSAAAAAVAVPGLDTRKVFLEGIDPVQLENRDIKAYFSQFGRVDRVFVGRQKLSRNGKAFGFVAMGADAAVDLICALRRHVVKGCVLECRMAMSDEFVRGIRAVGGQPTAESLGRVVQQIVLRCGALVPVLQHPLVASPWGLAVQPPLLLLPIPLIDYSAFLTAPWAGMSSAHGKMTAHPGSALACPSSHLHQRYSPYEMPQYLPTPGQHQLHGPEVSGGKLTVSGIPDTYSGTAATSFPEGM